MDMCGILFQWQRDAAAVSTSMEDENEQYEAVIKTNESFDSESTSSEHGNLDDDDDPDNINMEEMPTDYVL